MRPISVYCEEILRHLHVVVTGEMLPSQEPGVEHMVVAGSKIQTIHQDGQTPHVPTTVAPVVVCAAPHEGERCLENQCQARHIHASCFDYCLKSFMPSPSDEDLPDGYAAGSALRRWISSIPVYRNWPTV
ncbi:hypothetical protein AVEN_151938-1 [Araneus ventricosus]|uniref:Uncharacterized protein n=1 Tax=Araneus ventricosus TaxID=182803 RepID=A0A4Y2LGW7_ARAVE|nr:hypothetical protein AVEN_151938-1 [Araneus ventricosus]